MRRELRTHSIWTTEVCEIREISVNVRIQLCSRYYQMLSVWDWQSSGCIACGARQPCCQAAARLPDCLRSLASLCSQGWCGLSRPAEALCLLLQRCLRVGVRLRSRRAGRLWLPTVSLTPRLRQPSRRGGQCLAIGIYIESRSRLYRGVRKLCYLKPNIYHCPPDRRALPLSFLSGTRTSKAAE